ncbi:three-helix bundle dimerization domain-containing protein [Streptomyces sp. NPDC093225]|uniref:three-helix bundle dimerization domain-containing protein n=1 Tax=Streptomyces sp. NPDC093225 TaxID=3366034 RepID=UPI00380DC0B2
MEPSTPRAAGSTGEASAGLGRRHRGLRRRGAFWSFLTPVLPGGRGPAGPAEPGGAAGPERAGDHAGADRGPDVFTDDRPGSVADDLPGLVPDVRHEQAGGAAPADPDGPPPTPSGPQDELASVRDIVVRLRAAYPLADAATVEGTVRAAYASFHHAKVRAYIPILVERRSRSELRATHRTTARPHVPQGAPPGTVLPVSPLGTGEQRPATAPTSVGRTWWKGGR